MSAPHAEIDPRLRELLAVLAHELRSPIGALLGFEELLSEGIYGTVDDQAREGLARMRYAARQLLQLIDGMSDLALHQPGTQPTVPTLVHPGPLLESAVTAQRADADSRHTTIELQLGDDLPPLRTDPDRAARALQLAIGAAIKNTHGGTIRIAAHRDHAAALFELTGAGLSRDRDDPEHSARLSGAGLRIAMARTALEPLHGTLTLHGGEPSCTLRLRLPPLPD
jgi:signal transduction histidine kinase